MHIDTLRHQPTAWPVTYTCALSYHGQLFHPHVCSSAWQSWLSQHSRTQGHDPFSQHHGSRSLAGSGTVCLRFSDFWDFYAASEIGFSTRYQQLQNMVATFTCYPGTREDKGALAYLAWNPLEPSISQFWEPDCCHCRH